MFVFSRKRSLILLLVAGLFACPAVDRSAPLADDGAPPGEPYKIVVRWDGRDIPGIDRVTGLRRFTEVLTTRSGGDPSATPRTPGVTRYEPIVLERPWCGDSEFERWANKTWNLGSGLGSEVSLKNFRKDISIEFYDDDARLVVRFQVYRCWPSGYEAMGDYGRGGRSAVERLVLEHEGWERDYSVAWP